MKISDSIQLYPFVRITLFLMAGIILSSVLHPSILFCFIAAMVLLIASLLFYKFATLQSVILLFCFMALGAGSYSYSNKTSNVRLPKNEIEYKALIISEPREHGKVLQCDMLITNGRLKGRKIKASILRDTVNYNYLRLKVGSGLIAQSKLETPKNFHKHSHFDYVRWLKEKGYIATTFIYYRNWKETNINVAEIPSIERFRLWIARVRDGMLQQYTHLGLVGQAYAVVAAMTLGDKSEIDKTTKDVYSITGASHTLAVSGLHLGVIYAILTFLFGRRKRLLGQIIILFLIWLYAALTGFSSSVVRAATMLTLYSIGSLAGEDKLSINTLCVAAFIMLLIKPTYLWDISFQMSFMAMVGILLLYIHFYHLLPHINNKFFNALWGMFCISLSAQILTFPLIAYYFGRFSCYSLITNFLVVPSASCVIYLAFAAFVLTPLPSLQMVVGWMLNQLVNFLNNVLMKVSSFPGASIEEINISVLQTIIIYVMIACLLMLLKYGKRGFDRSIYIWK
jgi:competence protein ComEC